MHVERHLRRDMKFYMKHISCKVASVSDNLFVDVPKPFVTNASSKETVEQKLFSFSRSVQPNSNMEEDDKNIGEANVRSLVSLSDYYSSITSQDYSDAFKLSMSSTSKSRFEDSSIMAIDGVVSSGKQIAISERENIYLLFSHVCIYIYIYRYACVCMHVYVCICLLP